MINEKAKGYNGLNIIWNDLYIKLYKHFSSTEILFIGKIHG